MVAAGRQLSCAGLPYVGGSGRAAHPTFSFLHRLSRLGHLVSIPECSGQRHHQTLPVLEDLVATLLISVPFDPAGLAKLGECELDGTVSLVRPVDHSRLHPTGKVLPLHWTQNAPR